MDPKMKLQPSDNIVLDKIKGIKWCLHYENGVEEQYTAKKLTV